MFALNAQKSLICIFSVAILTCHGSVRAAVFNVDSTVDEVDAVIGDGICRTASGDCTLRAAVQEANDLAGADSINLPSGTYVFTIPGNDDDAEEGDLDILDELSVQGAGESTTIVDANLLHRHFEVRDGFSLTVSDLTLKDALRDNKGSSIEMDEGSLFVSRVRFENNSGNDNGGAVFLNKAGFDAEFTDVGFFSNSAKNGGAIFSKENAAIVLVRATFDGNSAQDEGGALYIDKGNLTIDQSDFTGNTAGKNGGAVYIKDKAAITTVDESRFTGNDSVEDGGALYLEDGQLTLTKTLFDGNEGRDGGAIFAKDGDALLDMTNSTLSGNDASNEGGGIYFGKGTHSLSHVTIADNTAIAGAGVFRKDAMVTLSNSLLSNNSVQNCNGTVVSAGNNLDSGTTCAFGQPGDINSTDPMLGPLQNNGGFTLTHALLVFSPARDSALNGSCPVVDQRGNPRPSDGDGDGNADCDIGAYEASEPLLPDYRIEKTVLVSSDPFSAGNPKAVPGAVQTYTLTGTNAGPGAAQADTIVIEDEVPIGTALIVADFDGSNPGPVAFVDGTPASGLTYAFVSLASTVDDIEFSNDGGISYTYVPVADANGADSAVTHFRLQPSGTAGFTGASPVFQFVFRAEVQ